MLQRFVPVAHPKGLVREKETYEECIAGDRWIVRGSSCVDGTGVEAGEAGGGARSQSRSGVGRPPYGGVGERFCCYSLTVNPQVAPKVRAWVHLYGAPFFMMIGRDSFHEWAIAAGSRPAYRTMKVIAQKQCAQCRSSPVCPAEYPMRETIVRRPMGGRSDLRQQAAWRWH